MGITSDGISFSQPTGKVLKLPCKYVRGTSNVHPAVLSTIKFKMSQSQTNLTPVMVKALGEDDYVAIGNVAILQAARELDFPFVKSMIIEASMLEQVEVESGNKAFLNIQDASKKEIYEFFDYLKLYAPGFSRIQPQKISKLVTDYREEHQILSIKSLTKLKCGIGKAKIPTLQKLINL